MNLEPKGEHQSIVSNGDEENRKTTLSDRCSYKACDINEGKRKNLKIAGVLMVITTLISFPLFIICLLKVTAVLGQYGMFGCPFKLLSPTLFLVSVMLPCLIGTLFYGQFMTWGTPYTTSLLKVPHIAGILCNGIVFLYFIVYFLVNLGSDEHFPSYYWYIICFSSGELLVMIFHIVMYS